MPPASYFWRTFGRCQLAIASGLNIRANLMTPLAAFAHGPSGGVRPNFYLTRFAILNAKKLPVLGARQRLEPIILYG